MSTGVNVGGIESFLRMRDDFTATFDKFDKRLSQVEAQVTRTSRKQVDETAKAKAAYDKLAASLDPVIARQQRYEKSTETLTTALRKGVITQEQYNATLRKAESQLQTTTHWTQRLGTSIGSELSGHFTRFIAISALVSLGVGTIVSVTKQLVTANIEAEASGRRVEEAVRRYGERSGVTAEQVDEIAQSISRLTGIDDELIADAEVIGLKFNRITSDVFPRFAKVATDLGVAIGDVGAGFEKAGKLVNQPLRALTLFAREGYAVGESQAALIKQLVAAGDIESAQVEILKILEAQYGGTAEAARDTMGGALQALQTSWENLLEELGKDSTGPIRDGLEKLITLIDRLTGYVDDLTVGWYHFEIATNRVLIVLNKMQLGASEGPLARLLNPAGAKVNADKLRGAIADLEDNMVSAGNSLANVYLKRLGVLPEAHRKAGHAALEQTAAEGKLGQQLDKTAQAVRSVADSIDKLVAAALDQVRLYDAAIKGQKALNEEVLKQKVAAAILKEEERLRTVNKTLTADQRREIEAAIRSTDKFKVATDGLVASWSRLKSLSDIEVKAPDFSKIPFIEQSVMEIGVVLNPKVNEDFEAQWLDFTEAVENGLKSDLDALEDYELQLKIARDLGYGNAIMWEEELARVRQAKMALILDDWTSFANSLANMFGGLFNKIASMMNSIQSAYQTGNQLGGMMQKYAGAGAWASNMGMYFAAFQAFYDLTQAWTAHTERQRGRTYMSGYEAQAGMSDGSLTFGGAGVPGQAIAQGLREALDGILSAIGGFLADLPDIEIRIRNDGKKFQLYIAGVFLGVFSSAEEAIGVAVQQAVANASFVGIGQEVARVLELAGATLSMTMDELQHNLDVAKQTERLRLGDVGAGYVDTIGDLLRLMEAQKRLGLSIEDTIDSIIRETQATKNRTLGIDDSTSRQLANIRSLNDGMAQASQGARAAVQREIDLLMQQIAAMEARGGPIDIGGREGGGTGGGAGGGGGESPGQFTKDARSEWEESLRLLREKLSQYLGELDKIPEALSDTEINMGIFDALYKYLEGNKKYAEEALKYAKFKVEVEFLAIKAQLMLMNKWVEFEAMYNDAYNAAMAAAGRQVRGGGGARSGERQTAREFADDRRRELSMVGYTEFQRALADLNKEYEEQIANAGKDAKLRAELLTLQREQTAQLEQEVKQDLAQRVQAFLGLTTQFDQVRKTAADLIHDIEESPFGNERKARMIGRVVADVDRQIQELSDRMAADLLGNLAQYITDEELRNEVLTQQAIINYNLALETARVTYARLLAEGHLSENVKNMFERSFQWFEEHKEDLPGGANWTFGGGSGTGTGGTPDPEKDKAYLNYLRNYFPQGVADLNDALRRAVDLMKKYADDELDPLSRALKSINEDFDEIEKALGKTPDVLAARTKAIDKAMEDAFKGVKDFYTSLLSGPDSQLPVEQQYEAAMANYERILNEVANKDYSELGDLDAALQAALDLAGAMYDTSTGGYAAVRDRMLKELKDLLGNAGIDLPGVHSSQDLADKANAGILQFVPKLDDVVRSTDQVATVVDLHGYKQEVLLGDVVKAIKSLQTWMEQNGQTGGNIKVG